MSSWSESKPTLEFHLRKRAVPGALVLERHGAVVPLVARILGVVPRVFSYLEIWPPALDTYSLVVPAFFDLPACDLGRGLGSKRRSLIAYASSVGYGCMYCAAHTAVLGNIFSGARESLASNAAAIRQGACPLPTPEERALVEYGLAVGRPGGAACTAEMSAVAEYFSPSQVEQVVLVAATMGLLNRCLDTFGMVLEGPLLETARAHLASVGWDESKVYDERFDRQLLETELPPPHLNVLSLSRCLFGALRFESAHLAAFPSGEMNQAERAFAALGFRPTYLTRFRSGRVRKTLLHLLLDRLMGPGGPLSPGLRCMVLLVLARGISSPTLEAHSAHLAARELGLTEVARLLTCLDADTKKEPEGLPAACLCAAREAAAGGLSPKTVHALSQHLEDAAIIDLLLSLSIGTCLHRILRSFPQQLEPEIRTFVDESGQHLGLLAV